MSLRKCVLLDENIVSSGFFDSFDYVLTDCDGVLWLGNTPIPGSIDAIKAFKKMGKQIIYVTNNSTKSCEDYLKKCEDLGFPAEAGSFFSTSFCVARYLATRNFQKKVYVIGTEGVTKELQKANIKYLPIGSDVVSNNWIEWVDTLVLDPEVGAVIVAFDHHISYPKLTKAASYLKNPDTLFLATNKDAQFPMDKELIMPGTGTFVHAVEVVTDREALSMGKPEKYILDCVKEFHPDINFSRCIMIGDRLNTDIMFGTKHDIKTLFVLTGINSIEDVKTLEKSAEDNDQLQVPDYYLPCLGEILKFT